MARRGSPLKQPARFPRAQTLHTARILLKSKVLGTDQGSPEIERVKSAVVFLPVAWPKTG